MGLGTCCAFIFVVLSVFVGMVLHSSQEIGVLPWTVNYLEKVHHHPDFVGLAPAVISAEENEKSFKYSDKQDLSGKVALVTGGNTGLGFSTVKYLALNGAQVVCACRSKKKCDDAVSKVNKLTGKETVSPMIVDQADLSSVEKFSKEFLTKYKKLDIFVQNAGIAPFKKHEKSKDGIEIAMAVNHFSHFLITKHLLPVIEAAGTAKSPARIVVVSSCVHYSSHEQGVHTTLEDLNDPSKVTAPYEQSKFANVVFGLTLAERVKGKNILVNIVHPGLVATNMQKLFGEAFAEIAPDFLVDSVVKPFFGWLGDISFTPDEGARAQIFLATKVTTSGGYYHPHGRKVEPREDVNDKEKQSKLWELSENVLKTKGF